MGARVVLGLVGAVLWSCDGSRAQITSGPVNLLDGLPREEDTGLWLVDDQPVESEGQARQLMLGETATLEQGLTVNRVNGKDDLWPASQRQKLSYCIDSRGFGGAAQKVSREVLAASTDWAKSANIQFVHHPEEDVACDRTNPRVVFNVRRVSQRPYLARSFFPAQSRGARELLIDDDALSPDPPLTLTGVLRHELGHVLGLRHEHIRAPDTPCPESGRYRAVTAYDVRSVMHYPQCGGVYDRDLTLTVKDREGIAKLYP